MRSSLDRLSQAVLIFFTCFGTIAGFTCAIIWAYEKHPFIAACFIVQGIAGLILSAMAVENV